MMRNKGIVIFGVNETLSFEKKSHILLRKSPIIPLILYLHQYLASGLSHEQLSRLAHIYQIYNHLIVMG